MLSLAQTAGARGKGEIYFVQSFRAMLKAFTRRTLQKLAYSIVSTLCRWAVFSFCVPSYSAVTVTGFWFLT